MLDASLDGIPSHDVDLTAQLFDLNLRFFSSQSDIDLEQILNVAAKTIEEDRAPFKELDVLRALSDAATHRGIEIPEVVHQYLDSHSQAVQRVKLESYGRQYF